MNQQRVNLHKLAYKIAAHLPGWRQEGDPEIQGDEQTRLIHDSGAALWLLTYQAGSRMEVKAIWPEPVRMPGSYNRTFTPRACDLPSPNMITVAMTRRPVLIAKAIEKRMLAWYLPEWEKQAAKRQKALQQKANAEQVVDLFAAALVVEPWREQGRIISPSDSPYQGKPYIKVEAVPDQYGPGVNLTIHCHYTIGLEIVSLVKHAAQRRKETADGYEQWVLPALPNAVGKT